MSSTLNKTKTAVNGAEAVRESTGQTLVSTLSAMVKVVNAVSGVVAVLRSLDLGRDDRLAWFGLERRRPRRSAAVFSAGVTVGAGLGMLFAPMAGTALRRTLLMRRRERKEPAKTGTAEIRGHADDAKSHNGSHSLGVEAGR